MSIEIKNSTATLFFGLLFFIAIVAQAQEKTNKEMYSIFEEMPYVNLHQDDTITSMLLKIMELRQERGFYAEGYRVQLYSSNNQQIARDEALRLESELSLLIDEPVYLQYDSPFWKLRVGNFKTQDQANTYKTYLINLFPKLKQNAYVVRDIIKL